MALTAHPARRGAKGATRAVAVLDTVGNALILQLCFVVVSLPLMSVFPAAVALQRSLDDLRSGEATGVAPYARHVVRAWRQYWRLGFLSAVLMAGVILSLSFWLSADSVPSRVAQGVLVFWAGLGAALYLSLLHTTSQCREIDARTAVAVSFTAVRSDPIRALVRLVLLGSWLLVLAFMPALALVGSGLVPAMIARYALVAASTTGKPHSR